MTKKEFQALEKIVKGPKLLGQSLLQSKAAVYRELADKGLVREEIIHLKSWPPCTVTGWILTEAGHVAYHGAYIKFGTETLNKAKTKERI